MGKKCLCGCKYFYNLNTAFIIANMSKKNEILKGLSLSVEYVALGGNFG